MVNRPPPNPDEYEDFKEDLVELYEMFKDKEFYYMAGLLLSFFITQAKKVVDKETFLRRCSESWDEI